MEFDQSVIDAAMEHARAESPAEACGYVLDVEGHQTYFRCRNSAAPSLRNSQFEMHPVDQIKAEKRGRVLAIVHSHPHAEPEPSVTDLMGVESSRKPWLIVAPHLGTFTVNLPTGEDIPLKGRPFVYGLTDCASLIRDYYAQELGIHLPHYEHNFGWWDRGRDLWRELPPTMGFVRVTGQPLAKFDVLVLMLHNAPVPTHGAIYFPPEGENPARILHHVQGRVPRMDTFGGYWQKAHVETFRHPEVRCS